MAKLKLGVDVTVEGARELQRVSDALSGTGEELRELGDHLDAAADSARRMADDVDAAAGSINFDRANASAQALEDGGEGLRNMVNGLGDAFTAISDPSLTFGDRLALMAGGVADMANGVRNFAIPAITALANGALTSSLAVVTSIGQQLVAWATLGVQSLIHAAKVAAAWVIALGPIGLLVAAVVGAVALIIANWDHVSKFLGDIFATIGDAMEALGKWITDIWDGIIRFLSGIISTIRRIAGKLWKPIGTAFGAAIDVIKGIWNSFARWWNSVQISVPSVDVPLVGKVGGFTIGLPDLPMLAKGGIVTDPTLALVGERGPEAVVPLDKLAGMGGPREVHYHTHLTVTGDLQARNLREVEDSLYRVARFANTGIAPA